MNLPKKAIVFATAAHSAVGQLRKYTDEPYIVHPLEVMRFVSQFAHTDEMLAAAVLHDVVEDTGVTIELIESEFGSEVAELVGWLTDVSQPSDGNRATRKAIDREHSSKAPSKAQTIKLADLWSNTKSIVEHDLNFAVVYLKEKRLLLEVLTKADPEVRKVVNRCLVEAEEVVKGLKNE